MDLIAKGTFSAINTMCPMGRMLFPKRCGKIAHKAIMRFPSLHLPPLAVQFILLKTKIHYKVANSD